MRSESMSFSICARFPACAFVISRKPPFFFAIVAVARKAEVQAQKWGWRISKWKEPKIWIWMWMWVRNGNIKEKEKEKEVQIEISNYSLAQ